MTHVPAEVPSAMHISKSLREDSNDSVGPQAITVATSTVIGTATIHHHDPSSIPADHIQPLDHSHQGNDHQQGLEDRDKH